MNIRARSLKQAFFVCVVIILFVSLLEIAGHAQDIDRDVSLSIMKQYQKMHENARYLKMQGLVLEKRMLSAEESMSERAEQIDAEIGIIANSLRSSLFRNSEKIYNLQQLRYDLFSELLIEKQKSYEATKCSDKEGDIVKCDALFSQMQKLEIKVCDIEEEIKRIERTLFKDQVRARLDYLLHELDRVQRDDFAAKVRVKREILFLLKEITIRLDYSSDTTILVEKEIKALDEFISTYSYWGEIENENAENMINVYKTPYEDNKPTKPWDHSEMVGRRNYMDTVVKKENDKRKGTKRNPRNIQRSAPQSTLGMNVKEKVMARED